MYEKDKKNGWKGGEDVLARIGILWGLGGVIALLSSAVLRLVGLSIEAFGYTWDWRHWTVFILNIAFMAYSEGYKGFQKSFAPRVVARAQALRESPSFLRLLLAPLFCMGYFHATRRRLISVYALAIGIITLIVAFQYISQPWRGILDCGVVIGLAWGIASIGVLAVKAWLEPGNTQAADLPESHVPTTTA